MRAAAFCTVLLFAPAVWGQATAMAVAVEPVGKLAPAKLAALEDGLTSAADELFAESVVGPGDVADVGEENPELASCESVFCWSRVGRELSAGLVLVVRVAPVDDKLLLSMRLIDTAAERVVLRRQQPIPNDVLTFATDCRAVMHSLRADLPAPLRAALRGAAPPPPTAIAPAPAPVAPEPATATPPKTEPIALADTAVDNPGWLGVKHVSVDFEVAERIGLSPPLGAQIEKMSPDGSAAQSGLRDGDVVIDYGGYSVKSRGDLVRLVRRTPSGTVVPITVWRGGGAVVVPTRMVARDQAGAGADAAPRVGASPAPAEPNEPRTVTHESMDVSDSGFTYSREEVTEVTEPIDSATFVTWSLSGIYIAMEIDTGIGDPLTSKAYGAGVSLGFRYLDPFGEFPGPDSATGVRHCVSLSGSALLSAIRVSSETSVMGNDMSFSSTMAYMELGAILGYTFLSFGAFNPDTLEQSGWGITLGVQGGVTRMFDTSEGAESEFNTFVRPAFGLEFPSYNPGTGAVSTFNIMGFIYPKSDMFTVVLAMGGSF